MYYLTESYFPMLSGALTDAMHYDWDEYFTKEQMLELNESGYITVKREGEKRKTIIIDKQMLMDYGEVNQRELLKQVTCPVLIIHGNNAEDEEELLLLERSKRAMQYLSGDSKLEIIDGATHSFLDHLDHLTDLSHKWYINHLGR